MKHRQAFYGLMTSLTIALAVLSAILPTLLIPKPGSPPPPSRRDMPKPTSEPADVAAPQRLKNGSIDPNFIQQMKLLDQMKTSQIDLLFLGDSITRNFSITGSAAWQTLCAGYHPANFGIGSDRTQHLLWRIENGLLSNVNPKVVVLLIGTNNTDSPVDDITRAVTKIVGQIREKLPQSKLLLLGIFPRQYWPTEPVRQKIILVNAQLSKLDDGHAIRFLDIGGKFLSPRGTLILGLTSDELHPSPAGYQVWADAMRPLLDEMMNAK